MPDVRTEAAAVLHRALQALVTEPPGGLSHDTNLRLQVWANVKELNAMRNQWIKSGWHEEKSVRDQIEHWYKLMAAIYEPGSA